MDEEEAPKKKPEPVDGPLLTERDKMKLERRKRKEDRQREVRKKENLHPDSKNSKSIIVD